MGLIARLPNKKEREKTGQGGLCGEAPWTFPEMLYSRNELDAEESKRSVLVAGWGWRSTNITVRDG
jgi:hypothetical protein